MHRSLTSAETDPRRLRRNNAKALWLGIEASELLAREETAKAKAARHATEQARAVGHLSGYISLASESGTTSADDDDDDPPAADTQRSIIAAPTTAMGRARLRNDDLRPSS